MMTPGCSRCGFASYLHDIFRPESGASRPPSSSSPLNKTFSFSLPSVQVFGCRNSSSPLRVVPVIQKCVLCQRWGPCCWIVRLITCSCTQRREGSDSCVIILATNCSVLFSSSRDGVCGVIVCLIFFPSYILLFGNTALPSLWSLITGMQCWYSTCSVRLDDLSASQRCGN